MSLTTDYNDLTWEGRVDNTDWELLNNLQKTQVSTKHFNSDRLLLAETGDQKDNLTLFALSLGEWCQDELLWMGERE